MRIWAMAALAAGLLVNPGTPQARDLVIQRDGQDIRISPLGEGIVRVRIGDPRAPSEDASWAVPAGRRHALAPAQVSDSGLALPLLRVELDPTSHRLRFTDPQGATILAEAALPLVRQGSRFTLATALTQDEHIFGLGDKTGPLDRRGESFTTWNTDSFGFGSATDPVYKSIPFFISVGGPGGAYGVLLDNPARGWFDFGHRAADRLEMGAEQGPIDYYVIAGPSVADVTRRYAWLTGTSPLPPRWALGYQQSRWSYASEAEVRDLAARLQAERMPTDVIWLDIDFQDRNRPFTIDRQAFPHFAEMVRDLAGQGIRTVAITDLHIAAAPNQGYDPYDSGLAGDHFLHRADGSLYVAPVWPGPAVFPEFTRTATRRWWGGQFKALSDMGIAGIWNDMNEPAIFETPIKTMPSDVRHRIESDDFATRLATHAEIHNVYGMLNTRATFEGLEALRPGERPFVMTRASYAGGQRYAATWTGDNSATWDHLRLALAQTLNLGLSGFTWTGTDIGGFTGGPTPELLTRWFQYGAFLPIMRDHSQKAAPRAEPWVDGPEQLAIRRHFVEERYRLLPFLYSLAEISARTGDPIARPVFYDYPGTIRESCDTTMSFTLGGRLLVAGPGRPEQHNPYQACLPAGGWFDYWSGDRVNPAPSRDGPFGHVAVTPALETLPVFVRAGTILPRQPLVQSTSQTPEGPLALDIYPGPDCAGEIYDDDGHSRGYTTGDFVRQRVTCEAGPDGVHRVAFGTRAGSHRPWWKAITITIHGTAPAGQPPVARLHGKAVAVRQVGGRLMLDLADQPTAGVIEFTR